MTGSKSANVDQPLPGQALPQHPDGESSQTPPPAAELQGEDMQNGSQATLRHGPIPPASEPLQYRAIGLIRGVYIPSEDQFTRGNIVTEEKTAIDAVLLGRVMSLVKKHVDLAQPHLWVVYPRTRPGNNDLHAQIVGIWDPENLSQDDDLLDGQDEATTAGRDGVSSDTDGSDEDLGAAVQAEGTQDEPVTATPSEAAPAIAATPPSQVEKASTSPDQGGAADPQDGYFSIRGEVIRQSRGSADMTIKICQAPRKGETRGRMFKLLLKGSVDRRAVGSFWDMHIQRQGNDLVIQEANFIKDMPPTKRQGRSGPPHRKRPGASGPPRRRHDRPAMAGQRQGDRRHGAPLGDRPAPSDRSVPKPIIKRQSRSSSAPSE
ncbi:MAG: hypothetical protein WBA10_18485 [Elainellaceae cyanobacterium]